MIQKLLDQRELCVPSGRVTSRHGKDAPGISGCLKLLLAGFLSSRELASS